jgi:hypothetical protein
MIEATSQTLASRAHNSIAGAMMKTVLKEKINIFNFDFLSQEKLTMLGGTKTKIIESKYTGLKM